MRSIYKPAAFVAAILLAFGVFAACNGGSQRACASPMYSTVSVSPDGSATVDGAYYKGASGGGGGFSGGSSGGGRSYSPPSGSGARSGGSSSGGSSSGKSYSPPSNSGAKTNSAPGKYTAPVNSGARPSSTPVGGVPTKLSGNSYTYHGTNGVTHVYVYHGASYWHTHPRDPFDPFDPRNFYSVDSPYYHTHIAC